MPAPGLTMIVVVPPEGVLMLSYATAPTIIATMTMPIIASRVVFRFLGWFDMRINCRPCWETAI